MEPGKTTEGDLEELSLLTSPLCLLIPVSPSLHVMGSLVNGTVYTLPNKMILNMNLQLTLEQHRG